MNQHLPKNYLILSLVALAFSAGNYPVLGQSSPGSSKEIMPDFSQEPGQVFKKEGPAEPASPVTPAIEPAKEPVPTASPEPASANPANATKKKNTLFKVSYIVTAGSFVTSWILGTPTAIVRATGGEIHKDARDVVETQPNIILVTASSPLIFPAGVFSGTLKGIWYGFRNSIMYSASKPFGKDCFSLGELNNVGSEGEYSKE